VSSCEQAPHAGDMDEGDLILSDSTTDVSDSEAPPYVLPAGVWDTRICPDAPPSPACALYRRLLPSAGALLPRPMGRWWLGGVREESPAAAADDDDAAAAAAEVGAAARLLTSSLGGATRQ
jgi:hypothetical protein